MEVGHGLCNLQRNKTLQLCYRHKLRTYTDMKLSLPNNKSDEIVR